MKKLAVKVVKFCLAYTIINVAVDQFTKRRDEKKKIVILKKKFEEEA